MIPELRDGVEGSPEVDAFFDVLHVHVDLDISPWNRDLKNSATSVDRAWTQGSSGEINLLRQRRHARSGVRRSHRVETHQVAEGLDALRLQASELCLRSHDHAKVSNRSVVRQAFDQALELRNVDPGRHDSCRQRIQRCEARSVLHASIVVDLPLPPPDPRQQSDVP